MTPGTAKVNIPYAAGIVDSRGHIELTVRRGIATPRVRVTTRRDEITGWLSKWTGVEPHVDTRGYDRRGCSEHCDAKHQHISRQSTYWNVDAARAVIVLYNVLPFMVCSTITATGALSQAQPSWPVKPRTEITEAMRRLGWTIPTRDDLPPPPKETE